MCPLQAVTQRFAMRSSHVRQADKFIDTQVKERMPTEKETKHDTTMSGWTLNGEYHVGNVAVVNDIITDYEKPLWKGIPGLDGTIYEQK